MPDLTEAGQTLLDDICADYGEVMREETKRRIALIEHEARGCDLTAGHDGDCWAESGTDDD